MPAVPGSRKKNPPDSARARAAKGPKRVQGAARSALGPGQRYAGEIPPNDPISRLPGEGAAAYQAFSEYAIIPPGHRSLAEFVRDLDKIPKELRKHPGSRNTIYAWAHTWRWTERLFLWDNIQLRRDITAAADENFDARRRRRLIANQALRAADALMEYILETLDDDLLRRYLKMGIKDVATFIKMATDLSRTEHSEDGIPTRRVVVEGGVDDALTRASPEELAALLRKSIAERVGERVLDVMSRDGNVVDAESRLLTDDGGGET